MRRFGLALVIAGAVAATAAYAEEEGMALSFADKEGGSKVAESIAAMQAWAEGEYAEHEAEGLFKKHSAEGRLIKDMLALSRELQAQGEALKQAGDAAKARAYFFSAEATARYAAQMPHMLERRVK
ncbi:MAG: hypothetical protein AB1469_06475 [Pseudomonadota bacterium]